MGKRRLLDAKTPKLAKHANPRSRTVVQLCPMLWWSQPVNAVQSFRHKPPHTAQSTRFQEVKLCVDGFSDAGVATWRPFAGIQKSAANVISRKGHHLEHILRGNPEWYSSLNAYRGH